MAARRATWGEQVGGTTLSAPACTHNYVQKVLQHLPAARDDAQERGAGAHLQQNACGSEGAAAIISNAYDRIRTHRSWPACGKASGLQQATQMQG
jgi:hypothetical protein